MDKEEEEEAGRIIIITRFLKSHRGEFQGYELRRLESASPLKTSNNAFDSIFFNLTPLNHL